MPLFPVDDESSRYFSMFDEAQPWCRWTIKPFTLDGKEWPSAEHYYQASKFANEAYSEKIRLAESGEIAAQLGKAWFKPKKKDWKNQRRTMMSRALYTQCQAYPAMAKEIIDTANERLVESSQYDYFWGCGRDRRGKNIYGEILMGIRRRLLERQNLT